MYIVWWIHVADSRLHRRQYCADVRNRGLKSPRLFMSTSSRRSRSSFTTHNSLLTAHRSKCLMSNPFGEICAICVSKNFGRCTQTSLPLITQNSPLIAHHSLLTTHCSPLTTQRSVVFASSACHCLHLSKNKKKGFWTEWRKSKNRQPSYSQANTKPWKTLRKHAKKRLKCFLSFT